MLERIVIRKPDQNGWSGTALLVVGAVAGVQMISGKSRKAGLRLGKNR